IGVAGRRDAGRELERRLRARIADTSVLVARQVHDGLGGKTAAGACGVTPVAEREAGLLAEAHAKLLAEAIARNDDARLDEHLADRGVDLPDDLPDFLEPRSRIGDEQD